MSVEIDVLADQRTVADRAAGLFVTAMRDASARADGPVHVAVTGGSTGIAVLRAIRQRGDEIDWSRVHVWWGDERFVPAEDAERNDAQAADALLSHVPLGAQQVHRVPTSDGPYGQDPDAAAAAYAAELARFGDEAGSPRFAVLMLGVGEEGHTASIFPATPAATDPRTVCAVRDCPKPPPTRITLTFGALSNAEEVWLMTTGASKAAPVAAALAGADPREIPAAGPRGRSVTRWLIDEAAAARLPRS